MGKLKMKKLRLYNKDPNKIKLTIHLDLNDNNIQKVILAASCLVCGKVDFDKLSFQSGNYEWVGETAFNKLIEMASLNNDPEKV